MLNSMYKPFKYNYIDMEDKIHVVNSQSDLYVRKISLFVEHLDIFNYFRC